MAEQIAPGRAEQTRGWLDYARFSTWLVHAFDEIGVETMRSKRLTVQGVLTDFWPRLKTEVMR